MRIQTRELYTRFVFPLLFGPCSAAEAGQSLSKAMIAGKEVGWERARPPNLYLDEVLDHVANFLFPEEGWGYLRISAPVASRLLPAKATVHLRQGQVIHPRLAGQGIELFLTDRGLAVLSLTFAPDLSGVEATHLLDFNYLLARVPPQPPVKIHIPHPEERPEQYQRLSAADRSALRPAPPAEAPAPQRIGLAGGSFTLLELKRELLRGLEPFGLSDVMNGPHIYTILRLDESAELERPDVASRAGPLLSALAQLEESTHAGAPSGTVTVPHAVMNRCHWAAVGMLGTAHIVSNQTPLDAPAAHPFDEQRAIRVRDRYFIPYLVALLQRVFLTRCIAQAGRIVIAHDLQAASHLRASMMEFGVGGQFSQINSREALHRYYRLSQTGLDTKEAWDQARQAIADMDAVFAAESDRGLADNVAMNIKVIARVQRAVHGLEYLFASVYLAHLWHMLAHGNTSLYEWVHDVVKQLAGSAWFPSEDAFVSIGVLFSAVLGFTAVRVLNRWLEG